MTSGLPQELIELMNDEVILEPATGLDKFNNLSFGSPVTVKAYVSRTNRRALDRGGRELISTVQAILSNPALVVTADDRLTLEDGTRPAIIEVLSAKDELGNDYYLEIRA
jgi:hypothetical protein